MTKKNNQEKPKRRFCAATDGPIIQERYATTPTLVSQIFPYFAPESSRSGGDDAQKYISTSSGRPEELL